MIIGFGENSIDYVYRLPRHPEPGTPASKVRIERRDVRPGGQVATVLATCARLGLPTRYVGAFGNDEAGSLIRRELEHRGIDVTRALIRPGANRYAVILVDAAHGERVVLWQRDEQLTISPADIRADWLDNATLVHVDATDEDASLSLARMAHDRGLPVTSDFDHVTSRTADLIDAVTIPIFAEHVPAELTGQSDVEAALRALRRRPQGRLVVTLGARGSAMLDGDRFLQVPAPRVDVVDSTGAGDVFRGAFIYALLQGDTSEGILRFANAAAAASCTKEGAIGGVPTLDEISALLIASAVRIPAAERSGSVSG